MPTYREDLHLGHKPTLVETDDLMDKGITTDKLDDAAVTTPKIDDKAITTPKLDDKSVTTPKLDDASVTTPKIADESVTTPKLGDASVTTPKIADKSVTWDKLDDDLQNTIASRKEGGVALSNKLGNSELLGITQKKLTEEITDIKGQVGSIADEEDLTVVKKAGLTKQVELKLKDKAYDPDVHSGMGRKYLRKNNVVVGGIPFMGIVENVNAAEGDEEEIIDEVFFDRVRERFVGAIVSLDPTTQAKSYSFLMQWEDYGSMAYSLYVPISSSRMYDLNGVPYKWSGSDLVVYDGADRGEKVKNVLTQAMLQDADGHNLENTIFHIQYDYTLDGESIEVPAGSILLFEGGSISNGTLTGDFTVVKAIGTEVFHNVTLPGNVESIDKEVADLKAMDNDLSGRITEEANRAMGSETNLQQGIGSLDSRLQQVEGLAELSVEGGQIGIASATDFTNRTTEGDLKIPTVGAILNAADEEPTPGSNNLVKSGGVHNELALGAVYDVSAKNPTAGPNNDGKWESLSALLSDANLNTFIPTAVRKGGMSIKFVQSSDNNYVQCRFILSTFTDSQFANPDNWENINTELSKKTLFQINADIKNIYLEQGGINSSGNNNASTKRVRTEYLPNKIDIAVNTGYKVFGVYYYDSNFVFVKSSTSIYQDSVRIHNYINGYISIVFCKTDNTQDILPTEDIIASVNTPTTNYSLLLLNNKPLEAIQDYEQQYEQVSGDITTISRKLVDIYTGELFDSSYKTKVYSITKKDVKASFVESNLNNLSGWCILANGVVVASCVTTTSNVLADVDLGYYIRTYNADTLMIGVNNSVTFDGVTVTRTKNTIRERLDAHKLEIDDLQDEISDLQDDVDKISFDFDVPDEVITKTQNYDESAGQRTVDASTGEYASAATASFAGEYIIQPEDISISYNTTKYTTNKGWVLLSDDNTVIHGEKTDDVADVSITLSDYPGAKKFRWCGKENSKTITIIAGVVKNMKDVVEDEYTKYKPFFDGTLNFQFTFAKPQLNNVSATDVEKVTTDIVNGAGLLRLAKNYSRNGVPTPLIIYFFGSAGYSTYSTSDFGNVLPYIEYLTKCGYNVMSVFGFYQGVTSRNFACPVGMSAISNAYKWVTENYNISKDGVFIYGRSFGGSNIVSFGYNSNIKTRAAAMFNCYIGDISNEHSNNDPMVKEFIFDNDSNYEWTSAYVSANLEKALPWSNLLRGIVDFGTREEMVYALMNAGNTMNENHAHYKDPTTIHRVQRFPLKMWTAEDDGGITNGMKWYRQTVIGTGGRCELRIMPSNYTDGERVPESVPHHICDTAGPVYTTLTTKLGYECEDVPVAYKEMVDWFDNN